MAKPIKTTGQLFKTFYADPALWTGSNHDWYIDDLALTVNGETDLDAIYNLHGNNFENLPAEASVLIENGCLCWQGKGAEPVRADGGDILRAFKSWLKEQTKITLVATLDLPKDIDPARLQKIVGVLESLGAKVRGGPEMPPLSAEEASQLQLATSALLTVVSPLPDAPGRTRSPKI